MRRSPKRSRKEYSNRIVAYDIGVPSGRGYFFEPGIHARICCPRCERVLRPYRPPCVRLKDYNDLSATYDCRLMASERFRRFCLARKLPGVEFILLNKRRRLFWFHMTRRLRFPRGSGSFERGPRCRACGYAPYFVGRPIVLKNHRRPISRGFYRSDISFGSCFIASPIMFVDPDTAATLRRAKMKGLRLRPVMGAPTPTRSERAVSSRKQQDRMPMPGR